jgi:hypothetical protein
MIVNVDPRLLKIFLNKLAGMVGSMLLGLGYVASIVYIENIWLSSAIAVGVPFLLLSKFAWDQSKYQLERELYTEQKIADRLSRDD